MSEPAWTLRLARPDDVEALTGLIDRSVRALQAADYSPAQLDVAIGTVFGVDLALIGDGTYFVVEAGGQLIGSGGWSRRATLFGVHQEVRDERRLTPGVEPARIRAFFVDPLWARRGVASDILRACEAAAGAEGFTRVALAATLTGVPFYRRHGFILGSAFTTPLSDGQGMELIAMEKTLG
jgi:GNAT superfamily N-acetyltransferase